MVFLSERLAGTWGAEPGWKTTPAQVNWAPGTISPEILSAPLVPLAPPSTAARDAVDLPPISVSDVVVQPPKAAAAFRSSKLLTRPDSECSGDAGLKLAPPAPTTVSITVLVCPELGPTIISKSPGSTTLCRSALRRDKLSGVIANSTVFFSPGSSVMR